MNAKVLAGLSLCVLVVLCYAFVLRADVATLEAQLQTRTAERDKAMEDAATWKVGVEEKQISIHGLRTTLEACLAREQTAMATADQWRDILENSQSRDMAPEEKGKVPDATTRRKLLDDLDRPL